MADAAKLDLMKAHKDEYATPKTPTLVAVRKAKYLAIDGQGAPRGEAFQARIGALYAAAFTIKMASKAAGRDYKVSTLEGIYRAADGGADFYRTPKETWRWTLLIRVPDFIGKRERNRAVEQLLAKGKGSEVQEVELRTLAEGRCVQMLHVGPYEKEEDTLAQMARFAEAQRLELAGPHHEIYLSDPRRVPPERLRTILRMPVRRGSAGR